MLRGRQCSACYLHVGWRPAGADTIWYDTANPCNVIAFGPGHWLLTAFALAAALVTLIDVAIHVHG